MQNTGQYLDTMRQTAPLVQNITNYVAMNIMANVMLAAGASPAMVHAKEESAEFASLAHALTINIGTPDPRWVASMLSAVEAATNAEKPWALDPVAAGATAFRRSICADLLALKPTIIRGNASEILALAGDTGTGRGADSANAVAEAQNAARTLAGQTGGIVAVTGPTDYVTDGTRSYLVANGHSLMPMVTALGCALTGITACFAVGQKTLEATVAALAYYGLAGEVAAQSAQGPGSFQVSFLDALHQMTPDQLTAGAQVTET